LLKAAILYEKEVGVTVQLLESGVLASRASGEKGSKDCAYAKITG
jgi:hypothetical protein